MKKFPIILSMLMLLSIIRGPILKAENTNSAEGNEVDFEEIIQAEEENEADSSDEADSPDTGEADSPESDEPEQESEPDLFARGRVENRFPITFQVPDGWIGEHLYDDDGDPYILYLPSFTDDDVAVRVQHFPTGFIEEPEETYLEFVIEATVDEGNYDAIEHEIVQGENFTYARIDLAATIEEERVFNTRFYRVLDDDVVMFQTYVFDVDDLEHVEVVKQMFLSQEIEEPSTLEVPADWTATTAEKATFKHPETWAFEETLRPNELPGMTYSDENNLIFDLFVDRFDEDQLQTADDYIKALEMYAEILAAEYVGYDIYRIDLSFTEDITLKMRSHGFNPGMDTLTDVQIFAAIDARDDTLYTMILEIPTTKDLTEKPDADLETMFEQLVQSFEISQE